MHYESAEPYDKLDISGLEHNDFQVEEMRFANRDSKATIVFNRHISISSIPPEAYEYVVKGKSAIEWLMVGCQTSWHKGIGIIKDSN